VNIETSALALDFNAGLLPALTALLGWVGVAKVGDLLGGGADIDAAA
jgi:hypothetical protein